MAPVNKYTSCKKIFQRDNVLRIYEIDFLYINRPKSQRNFKKMLLNFQFCIKLRRDLVYALS